MELGKKVGRVLALACMLAVMFSTVVFADTNCTVSIIGGSELKTGAQVEVQVKIKAENQISDTDVFITYDTEVMEFVSGDVSEDEDGNLRLREYFPNGTTEHTWNLTFKAVGEGSTRMKAENCWIKHYDEEEAGSSTASVMVEGSTFTVSGDAVATEAPTEDVQTGTIPAADAIETSGEALSEEVLELQALREEIENDGTMSCLVGREKWMVQETFPDSAMPYHFQVSSQFYKGVEVKAAKLTNAEYYLLYVKSEDGNQDKFVMYQGATKEFFDIQKIQMNDQFVLYLVDPSEADIPAAFKETTLQVGADEIRAWQLENQTQLSYGADPNQFYIVCGYNQNGVGGWFLYDSGMHTFQRYVELDSADDSAANAENAKLKNDYNKLADKFDFMVECLKYVSVILIALLLLLLIVNITEKKDNDGKDKEKKLTRKEKKALRKEEKARRKEEERKLLSDDWDKEEEELSVKETVAKAQVPSIDANKKEAPKTEKSGVEVLKPVNEEKEASQKKTGVEKASEKKSNSEKEVAKKPAKANKAEQPVEKAMSEKASEKKAKSKDFSITDSMEELSRQIQEAMNEDQAKKSSAKDDDFDDLLFINLDDE